MRKYTNNSISQYVLVAFLGMVLLFGQAFKFHMHIEHDGIPSSTTAHVIDVHATSSIHDMSHDLHHDSIENTGNHHHSAEIDISLDSLSTKIKLLNSLVLLFLVVSIFLCIPLLRATCRFYTQKIKPTSLNFLLYPPLRAPPV